LPQGAPATQHAGVSKLDRLGRNLKHLVTLVDDLNRRGVGFRVLTGAGAEIDTRTPNGRLVFNIFATLAEFERDLIAERTRAGMAAARARGRAGGRPPKMDVALLRLAMTLRQDRETSPVQLAKQLNISRSTLYTYVNGDGSPKAPGQALLASAHRVLQRDAQMRRHRHRKHRDRYRPGNAGEDAGGPHRHS
jgi:DNA invertase Pin-like site-specific DNA recombinase